MHIALLYYRLQKVFARLYVSMYVSTCRDVKFKIAEVQKNQVWIILLFSVTCRLESQHVHRVSYVEEEPVAVNRMGM